MEIKNGANMYETDNEGLDLRAREGNEQHIIRKVERHGGFSIFWITANQKRAHAATRLEESGTIIQCKDQYPWCAYRLSTST